MEWVKWQQCVLAKEPDAGPCGGGPWSEADHAGVRAGWRRAPDETSIPLCTDHHRDRTTRRRFFAGRSWEWMRSWCDSMIAMMTERYAARAGLPF